MIEAFASKLHSRPDERTIIFFRDLQLATFPSASKRSLHYSSNFAKKAINKT